MIILDTTVLGYAVGADHPLRRSCRELLTAVADGRLVAGTTAEVIQELCHVRARRLPRSDAVAVAKDFAVTLSPLLVVDERRLSAGLELFSASPELGSFDAVLAAVAVDADAEALVSADRAFASVPGLRHVFPDDRGVAALVRRS